MIQVSNKKCIRSLSCKTLRANKTRNLIAAAAIALTTLMFSSLFTIALTIVNSYQQETFRQVGGDMHGSFKDITLEQMAELKEDPLIVSSCARLILGIPSDVPFNKAHVEVSYMDSSCARGSFCEPEYGSLPEEGTNQIACDTRILSLLGVEPEIGARINFSYNLGINTTAPVPVEGSFVLSGWWEYDPASMASHAIVPLSYARQVLEGYERQGKGDITGTWTMNVYLNSTAHIQDDLDTILSNHGYQSQDIPADNFIGTGVNWAYAGAQFSRNADPGTLIAITALLVLIIFTGYLIIFNIFQISVTKDIRFYGLLKTIGTTPRQLRRLVRHQALALALMGIPIGLVSGYLAGNLLAPVIMSTLSYSKVHSTFHPLIFVGASGFSLLTVLISCHKPGKLAGKVSPVEAVRYTESGPDRRKQVKREAKIGKVLAMALANLSRGKKKTGLVVLSLSLSVVLLQLTYTFANGFDMDKYLRSWVVSDFILGDARYFQVGSFFSTDSTLPEEAIWAVESQGQITESGRIYGDAGSRQWITEEWYRQYHGRHNSQEVLTKWLEEEERSDKGLLSSPVTLYGMEKFPLDQLAVIEGDLSPLYDPSQNAIAAVYLTDDYGAPLPDSNWAKPGDQVTIQYVDEWELYDTRTGEAVAADSADSEFYSSRAKKYRNVTYTVAASVTLKHSMSYRYFSSSQFVLNADVYKRDSHTSNILNFLFNTDPEKVSSMEEFLSNYTQKAAPSLDYESKQSYVKTFEGFRNMFLLLGCTLSFIVFLVGVLNFLNAVLTSILARRREFAVLQSVGMTGRQLKMMLIWEGLFYSLFAIALSLVISVATAPLLGSAMTSVFWFFTPRFSILPIAAIAPVFLIFGVILPLVSYRAISKQSVVERLRMAE